MLHATQKNPNCVDNFFFSIYVVSNFLICVVATLPNIDPTHLGTCPQDPSQTSFADLADLCNQFDL